MRCWPFLPRICEEHELHLSFLNIAAWLPWISYWTHDRLVFCISLKRDAARSHAVLANAFVDLCTLLADVGILF